MHNSERECASIAGIVEVWIALLRLSGAAQQAILAATPLILAFNSDCSATSTASSQVAISVA